MCDMQREIRAQRMHQSIYAEQVVQNHAEPIRQRAVLVPQCPHFFGHFVVFHDRGLVVLQTEHTHPSVRICLADDLSPEAQPEAMVAPMNTGSAICWSTLSTAKTFSHSSPISSTVCSRPALCIEENQPPFPLGKVRSDRERSGKFCRFRPLPVPFPA